MRLDQLASTAIGHLLGRLVRRAIVVVAMATFAVIAIYHFTAAGMFALELQLGQLDARLIVGGIYAAGAVLVLGVFWRMRSRPAATSAPVLSNNAREMQLVMLVEAVMLGYSLARKREQAR